MLMMATEKESIKKEIINAMQARLASIVLQNKKDRFVNNEKLTIRIDEINQLISIVERM